VSGSAVPRTPFVWSADVDFAAISDTDVIGGPTLASAATGARIWEMVVAEGARMVAALLDGPRAAVRQESHCE
jgi:creatinine amidohydrolase/Fe(II)-dependent formamide hydrolase-like protein